MEIIIGLVIVVVGALLWRANSKDKAMAKPDNSALAPYKVEGNALNGKYLSVISK